MKQTWKNSCFFVFKSWNTSSFVEVSIWTILFFIKFAYVDQSTVTPSRLFLIWMASFQRHAHLPRRISSFDLKQYVYPSIKCVHDIVQQNVQFSTENVLVKLRYNHLKCSNFHNFSMFNRELRTHYSRSLKAKYAVIVVLRLQSRLFSEKHENFVLMVNFVNFSEFVRGPNLSSNQRKSCWMFANWKVWLLSILSCER